MFFFEDVCKITIFYSDKMVERVTREKNNNVAKFQVSESLCLAINNIDYVLQYIQPFVQVLLNLTIDANYCNSQNQISSPD